MNLRRLSPRFGPSILIFQCVVVSIAWAEPGAISQLQTTAEKSNYLATSRHEEVTRYLETLTANSPLMHLVSIGQSVEKRPLSAVIAAKPPVTGVADLANDRRLIVLLLGNIHAGECAGKEAIMALLRKLALNDRHDWLSQFIIVAIPNFNVDGNERQGVSHRPGQLGPRLGMGLRENAQGLDLNRDFMKLESPEVRALVHFIHQWNPHLFIDTHTTNGSKHRYSLTYDIPHNPASPAGPRDWLREELLPGVTERLAAKELDTFYYGNFNTDHTRWTTFGHEPRYSTEYVGLRGRLALLSEAYSYISYRERIRAHEQFITEALNGVAGQADQVRTLLTSTRPLRANSVPLRQSIRADNGPYTKKVTIKGYAIPRASQDGQEPEAAEKAQDYSVHYYGNFESSLEVARPFAYLLGKDYARCVDRLRWHGIQVHQLAQDHQLTVEQIEVKKLSYTAPVQGHRLATLETDRRKKAITFPIGTHVIYTGQPQAELITYLMEPRSDDGLTRWNFFDHVLEVGKPHPVSLLPRESVLDVVQVNKTEASSRFTIAQIYGPQRRIAFGGSFPLSLKWLPGCSDYLLKQGGTLYRVNAESGARKPEETPNPVVVQKSLARLLELTDKEALKLFRAGGQLSPSRNLTLYQHENDLIAHEHTTSVCRRLTTDKKQKRLVTFSPDSKHVAFIRDHNIIVVPVGGGQETAITKNGTSEQLYGYLDWVYQEELYGRGNYRGFWWNSNSRSLAFLHLDEKPVSRYTIADHLAYRDKSQATYYPKAGDPLPKVALAVYSLGDETPTWIDLSQYGKEFLISHVDWSKDGKRLYYQVQNREQTWLDLCQADLSGTHQKRLFRETTEAWVQSPGSPFFLADGSFLWMSESTGYRHIQHVTADGTKKPLTSGPWEVQKILGVDRDQDYVYFLANRESGAEAHAYRLHFHGGKVRRLTKTSGNHAVRFNEDFTHYLDYVSGVHQPISVYLHRADGTPLRSLAPNLVDYLDYYDVNRPEFITYPARDGHPLTSILIKPPGFDPSKKYPVLCHVYGGPQAPVARNRWAGSTYLWHQYLAQQGYVIWICDNRASTHQGARATWPIHLNMGHTELQDLADGVKWLTSHEWVEPSRIGLWGWSYGGYLTSFALTHSKLFKIGIAGAPVTDWRNYDAIYTERYMGLPSSNAEGYKKASPVHAANKLHGNLLLIHGSLDDNVHLANTLQFANALQNAGKQFQLMIYPNNRHGISRSKQSRHLRELMTKFILDNL